MRLVFVLNMSSSLNKDIIIIIIIIIIIAGRFASDLDGNPEVRFSHVAAQMHKVDQLVRICFTTAEKL